MRASSFDLVGYELVPDLIDSQTIKVLSVYYENALRRGLMKPYEPITIENCTEIRWYADPFGETLLDLLKPKIEEVSGKKLFPTYSFFRVYRQGEELIAHTDRPSCEISVTISIAQVGKISRIWMQKGAELPSNYELSPGSGVVYKGCDILHWREKMTEGQLVVQLMLHYVDKDGFNAEFKYDKRQNLGFPKET